MKKVIFFTFAMLFVIFCATAQNNDSDVSSIGDDNEVSVDQDGMNQSSVVYQKGNGSKATVEEIGTDNTSTIHQFGKNQAEVYQNGTNNNSDVDMGTNGSPVNNFDTDGPNGHNWGAFVTQIGDDNDAKIEMYGNNGTATTYQEGDDNIAEQLINTQQSGAIVGGRPGLDIYQFGNDNEAYQETAPSFGSFGIQDMTIKQIGELNDADQQSVGGMQSIMEIYQNGNDNESIQYQDGRFSEARATINGSNNFTDQYQKYTVWSTSGKNKAYIDIDGDDNRATQSQIGETNISDIYQNGDDNEAYDVQTGDLNESYVTQTGVSHLSNVTQTGNGNNSTVTQND